MTTVVFQPLSYGYVQVRISEITDRAARFYARRDTRAFYRLHQSATSRVPSVPSISPSAACATLLAAFLSSKMPSKWLVPLPPVVCNGVIVGIELHYLLHTPLILSMLSVAGGEAIACYAGGIPLMFALKKVSRRLFG
jgi:uncharacterized membrane protein